MRALNVILCVAIIVLVVLLAVSARARNLMGDRTHDRDRDRKRKRTKHDRESFYGSSEPVRSIDLTSQGVTTADPTACTLWPSGYTFATEGLVAHPESTPEKPMCILTRDGMGLLTNADPTQCTPKADQPELNWYNPFNQPPGTLGGLLSVEPGYVAGIQRCVASFAPGASASQLSTSDQAISLAGANIRSGLPVVLNQLEITTASLQSANANLSSSSGELASSTNELNTAASALAAAASEQQQTQSQLVALTTANSQALVNAQNTYQSQYVALQDAFEQRLRQQIQGDQDLLSTAHTQEASLSSQLASCQSSAAAARAAAQAAAQAEAQAQAQARAADKAEAQAQAQARAVVRAPVHVQARAQKTTPTPTPKPTPIPWVYHYGALYRYTDSGTGYWGAVYIEAYSHTETTASSTFNNSVATAKAAWNYQNNFVLEASSNWKNLEYARNVTSKFPINNYETGVLSAHNVPIRYYISAV